MGLIARTLISWSFRNQLAQVSDLVEAANGKLILIGDHRQLAEIDAGGLFAALTVRLPAMQLTENVRQTAEWERAALEELRDGSVSRAVAMYNRRHKIRTAPTSADSITAAVEAWHRDIRETDQPSDVLLIADRNTTVHQLNQQARACLARDGRLIGPAVVTSDRTFQKGDRVVCLKNRSRLGVLNGDLGVVTAADVDQSTITVLLDRTGHPVTIPSWYLDEGNLDWGYALTGHKAQGATAGRVHTVAGGSVDREWIYVAMSRGRQANTIYLTEPDMDDDECTHVAHEQPDRLPALMTALSRTAAQPAALDSGRGPQLLSDEQLSQRIGEIGPRPSSSRLDNDDAVANYVDLVMESEARIRDRLAELSYSPPSWLVEAIGERPSEPRRRQAWDRVAERSVRYRLAHGVSEDERGVIGQPPESRDMKLRAEWVACSHSMEIDLLELGCVGGRGSRAIGL